MFSTLPQKITLGIYVFLLLSIPVGAYVASEQKSKNVSTLAQQPTKPVTKLTSPPSPTASPLKATDELKKLSESNGLGTGSDVLPTSSSITYGPTLDLKLILEGRPKDKQASRTFIGIAEGTPTINPKYLISFTVDLPQSGEFKGLSLAGLESGTQYTAFIKPTAQIATSSAFVMSPSITKLNSGNALSLLTGDLNEDNTVNSADYSIAKNANGSTPKDENWNQLVDFNLDNHINALDLAILIKNYGLIGHSGVWGSTSPSIATSSAKESDSYIGNPVGPEGATSGYWIWIPR